MLPTVDFWSERESAVPVFSLTPSRTPFLDEAAALTKSSSIFFPSQTRRIAAPMERKGRPRCVYDPSQSATKRGDCSLRAASRRDHVWSSVTHTCFCSSFALRGRCRAHSLPSQHFTTQHPLFTALFSRYAPTSTHTRTPYHTVLRHPAGVAEERKNRGRNKNNQRGGGSLRSKKVVVAPFHSFVFTHRSRGCIKKVLSFAATLPAMTSSFPLRLLFLSFLLTAGMCLSPTNCALTFSLPFSYASGGTKKKKTPKPKKKRTSKKKKMR